MLPRGDPNRFVQKTGQRVNEEERRETSALARKNARGEREDDEGEKDGENSVAQLRFRSYNASQLGSSLRSALHRMEV